MPDGLRAIGRNLSVSGPAPKTCLPPLGVSSWFQLPQFYWNHLTNAIPGGSVQLPTQPQSLDASTFEFILGSPEAKMGMGLPDWSANNDGRSSFGGHAGGGGGKMMNVDHQPHQSSQSPSMPWDPSIEHHSTMTSATGTASMGSTLLPGPQPSDQTAIYSALMSFMVEAAKSQ
jgi:hypothetical protein